MQIKRGVAVTSIAAAMLLSPAIAATGSTTATAATASCKQWYVLGLHGMNEGPSTKGTWKRSVELKDFQADVLKDDPGGNGLHAVERDVAYPAVRARLTHPKATIKALVKSVKQGVADLQAKVKHYIRTCPGSLISMFGYSEGAWIINAWEQKHSSEAYSRIYSAALIGDPCYFDIAGDEGLARIFTGACGSFSYLDPYIAPTNSDCRQLDPICGVPYEGNVPAQVAATIACTVAKGCPHYKYAPRKVAKMASWMLSAT